MLYLGLCSTNLSIIIYREYWTEFKRENKLFTLRLASFFNMKNKVQSPLCLPYKVCNHKSCLTHSSRCFVSLINLKMMYIIFFLEFALKCSWLFEKKMTNCFVACVPIYLFFFLKIIHFFHKNVFPIMFNWKREVIQIIFEMVISKNITRFLYKIFLVTLTHIQF